MTNLTTDEIDKMCDRLKFKYPQHDKREDIKSEAILAIYERLANHPDTHPAELYNIARLAMSDFINLKDRVVTLPVNPTTRSVATKQKIPKSSEYSANGISAMKESLQPSAEYVEDENINFGNTCDCTEAYEIKDFIDKSMKLLNNKEKELINMRYFAHKTQGEVAEIYQVSQKTVSLWEDTALEKMSQL
jgi:RNA polymerase sigma factor (sigma-70 family)